MHWYPYKVWWYFAKIMRLTPLICFINCVKQRINCEEEASRPSLHKKHFLICWWNSPVRTKQYKFWHPECWFLAKNICFTSKNYVWNYCIKRVWKQYERFSKLILFGFILCVIKNMKTIVIVSRLLIFHKPWKSLHLIKLHSLEDNFCQDVRNDRIIKSQKNYKYLQYTKWILIMQFDP